MSVKRATGINGTVLCFIVVLNAATVGLFYLAFTRDYHAVARFDSIRMVMLVMLMPLLIKYIFQLVCSPLYSWVTRRRTRQAATRLQPSVSVIIPAWNEEVGILKTLWSVINTGYPNLQVIVVNDGSTDTTHEKVCGFLAEYEPDPNQRASVKYLNIPNGGKARAMNRGLIQAEGEIIVTVDADSAMDPAAIRNLVKHFDDPSVGGVAGNVIVGNRRKPIEWMQQMEYLYGFFFKRADSLFNSVYIIGGAAAAYRREVLEKMGGFDHTIITEDIEMSTRILRHGYKTRYACDAVVYTEGPCDLAGLCNQRLRWKYGRILTFIKHRSLFFSLRPEHNPYLTFLVLPIAVYAELLLLTEAFMLGAFFLYTFVTSDYLPLIFVVGLLSAVVGMQIMVDPKIRFHRNLLLLVPAAWILFYAIDLVEFQALVRSLKKLATRKALTWQRWVRVGVIGEGCIGTQPAYD